MASQLNGHFSCKGILDLINGVIDVHLTMDIIHPNFLNLNIDISG